MKALVAAIAVLLGGCTTAVTHPSKSAPEMRVDIDLCTEAGVSKFWYDAVSALYHAYGCLEDKGYKKAGQGWSSEVERTMGQKSGREVRPSAPCVVPCL